MMSVIAENVYSDIVRLMESTSFRRESLQQASRQHTHVPEETLVSIHSQLVQLHMKRTHFRHRTPEAMEQYHKSYLSVREKDDSATALLELAREVSLSPALYARIILEQYAEETPPFPSSPSMSVTALVSQWVRHPHSIPDPTLQLHVKTCFLQDTNYGPLAENIKRSVGCEYEFLLREKVRELQIPFLDEQGLRAQGYDKTPDIKLEVPVAVDGHVVNWIESKASFGDPTSHNKYLKEQFWSYQNRYGSGLVIYWFGYVTELNSFRDQGILLMERFPDTEQIVKLHTTYHTPP